MKFYLSLYVVLNIIWCGSQSFQNEQRFKDCNDLPCQIRTSFLNAEYFLEEDDILAAQNWLDVTQSLIPQNKVDTTLVFVHSLQSELFYYNNLFQFGINEADKAIEYAFVLKDSTLIANGYFFKGINLLEAGSHTEAENALFMAEIFQPKHNKKKYLRSAILHEHIYNNIAQLKLHINQLDSALWYNEKAYVFAKQNQSARGIPNTEQTFALIYLERNDIHNAILYLNKSIESANKSRYSDIVLGNYGFMMLCFPNSPKTINEWYEKGLDLMNTKKINVVYQKYFYTNAIKAFKINNQLDKLTFAQEQLIRINKEIFLKNDDYIQSINRKYLMNENQLLKQELEIIKSQREKQIYLIASLGFILLSLSIWLYFKQKQKIKNNEIITLQQQKDITKLQSFIDGEEKERKRLAQDLHDGINGDLSSIKYLLSSVNTQSFSSENQALLNKAIDMIDYSCDQVRNISHNLSPTSINDFGLITSLKNYCAKLEGFHPIKINFQHFGFDLQLSKSIETVIYRIVQELVYNIIKHADATEALVQINSHEDNLFITVEDNGKGISQDSKNTGIGLKNIASRIAFLNATLEEEVNSNGTTFTINIDLNNIPKT